MYRFPKLMSAHEQKKSLSVMTVDELKELIREHNLGGDIGYDIKHVYGEILFRDMLKQWDDDTEELEEEERKSDEGCGHDQNDNYYGKEEE